MVVVVIRAIRVTVVMARMAGVVKAAKAVFKD